MEYSAFQLRPTDITIMGPRKMSEKAGNPLQLQIAPKVTVYL